MSGKLKTWLPIAVFAILWLDLIRLLSGPWETREQYAYGWFVPLFAAALLWRRWVDRPVVSSQWTVVSGPVVSSQWSVVSSLPFLLCLLLLPLRIIFEINTDWPLIPWAYTSIVVVLTLYAFHLAGPQSVVRGPWSVVSPWVRHFAFPVCFILVAVAWPDRIEKGVTQGLMQMVASLTVELLGWLDIPALQRGNLIELSTGTVGVDEACSGIRSLQSSLMAALLMGELYRLRLRPRLALVAIGMTLSFCFNVVRTMILSWQANAHGLSAIDKWHDPAGLTITVACFFCLWAIAVLITKRTKAGGPRTTDHGTTGRQDHRTTGPQTQVSSQLSVASSPAVPVSSPSAPELQPSAFSLQPSPKGPVVSGQWSVVSKYLLALGLWSLLCIGATEAWYRSHAVKDAGIFRWSVALPEAKPGFQKIELPPRSLRLLAFDEGATAKWNEEGGSECSLFFFRWNPRAIQSVIRSRIHRPEVCLPASGFKQLTKSELVLFDAGQFKLPFREYAYAAEGRTLYVFFCQWEDGAEQQSGMGASGQTERLRSVWVGRRNLGQQTLELIVTGSSSLAEAETLVRRRLPELIRPEVHAS